MPCRVILRADDETASLLRTTVDGLDNVDELLLVLQHPLDLVVVARAQVDHHVLVSEEEHEGALVVELVHLVEVGHLIDVAEVDDGEVLHLIGDAIEHLVLAHAVGAPVSAEPDDYQPFIFAENGLVDVPAGLEMGKHETHCDIEIDTRIATFRGGKFLMMRCAMRLRVVRKMHLYRLRVTWFGGALRLGFKVAFVESHRNPAADRSYQ